MARLGGGTYHRDVVGGNGAGAGRSTAIVLFTALGFSGTGLMHAPAAGLLSAELIIDGAMRSVDGGLLSASRFAGAKLPVEPTGF